MKHTGEIDVQLLSFLTLALRVALGWKWIWSIGEIILTRNNPWVRGEEPIAVPRFSPHITWTSLGSNGLSHDTSFSWIVELFLQLPNRCHAWYSFVAGVISNFYFNVRKNKLLELLRGWHSCFIFGGGGSFLLQVSDRRPVLVTRVYRDFPHFLQVNAMILRQIRPLLHWGIESIGK